MVDAAGSPGWPAECIAALVAPSLSALVLAALFAICAFKAAPHLHRHWRLRHLPVPQGTHWLLGNVLEMAKPRHHLMLREAGKQLGGIFRIRLLWTPIVVLVDARHVHQALGSVESLNKAIEPDSADRLLSVSGDRTMFSADTDSRHWRLVRKGTAGAFQSKNLKNGFPEVLKKAQQLVDGIARLGPGADVDVNNVAMRYMMDVAGLVSFAKDYGTCRSFDDSPTDELFHILHAGLLEAYRCALDPLRRFMIFLPGVRQGKQVFRSFKLRMRALVAEVKARGPPAADDTSVAAHLLRLRDPDTGAPLSDDQLTGEFGLFFTAGIDTTANSITWTLFLISQRPDVEARLVAELSATGLLATPERPQPRSMELADLARLPYLANVSKEAMRVKPVVSTGPSRVTKRDLRLAGFDIPAGTLLLTPVDAVHHSPLNWDDPDAFNPDRWDSADIEFVPGTQDLGAGESGVRRFLPFGTGPRRCPGQPLATMAHDIGVAILLSHFSFRLAPRMGGVEGVLATEINRLTLQPGSGLWMNAIPRVKQAHC